MYRIPFADIIEVIGLLELVNDYAGEAPLDEIHNYTGIEFDELKPVVESAKILGLIELKGQKLRLTDIAKKLLNMDPEERKAFIASKIRQLPIFKKIVEELEKRGSIAHADLEKILEEQTYDVDDALKSVISWGTYAMIFDYDHNDGKVLPWRD